MSSSDLLKLLRTSAKLVHKCYTSMARANLNKSKKVSTFTIAASKYIPKRPRICIHWNYLFQTLLHIIFKNCFLWSKSCFTMFTFRCTFTKWIWDWKLKGISIDADSGPLGYVLVLATGLSRPGKSREGPGTGQDRTGPRDPEGLVVLWSQD